MDSAGETSGFLLDDDDDDVDDDKVVGVLDNPAGMGGGSCVGSPFAEINAGNGAAATGGIGCIGGGVE